jgi:hypothetical protein
MSNQRKGNKLKKIDKKVANKAVTEIPELNWDGEKKKLQINPNSASPEEYVKKFGVENQEAVSVIIGQMTNSLCKDMKYDNTCLNAALSMYIGLKPKDSLEAMLISQMVNVHNLAMEFSRRSMFDEQPAEGVERNINRVTKLMRTFTAQAECLNKYRTGGKQTIQVQHVNVNEGGQAIVGNVQGGGANG